MNEYLIGLALITSAALNLIFSTNVLHISKLLTFENQKIVEAKINIKGKYERK